MTTRRSFITGLVSFMAAPAIVRATNLMPVKAMMDETAIARAMRDYIEHIVRPPLMAALQDFEVYGSSVLEFADGKVRHVPFEQANIVRADVQSVLGAFPGFSPR